MSEELNSILESLFRESCKKVFEVYDIFKDFFDEERVDLIIGNMTEFKNQLTQRKYSYYINKNSILSSPVYAECSEQEKSIIRTLLIENALDTKIGSDITVFKYLYPFIANYIPNFTNSSESQILVHFPEVRVSNENDKFVDIKELYARVRIANNGTIIGTFGLFRADYPLSHIFADYAHSHISGITTDVDGFKSPCLGNGPIISTISSLARECDLNFWMLFCRELDTYVTVESLTGGPYRRLENITGTRKLRAVSECFSSMNHSRKLMNYYRFTEFPIEDLKEFIKYMLEQQAIKIGFSNNSYTLAMGYREAIISMSNCFIDYINNRMKRTEENMRLYTLENMTNNGLISAYVIKNSRIYSYSRSSHSTDSYLSLNGKAVFSFKGSDVKLKIYDDTQPTENNTVHLLNFNLCEFIIFNIITYLNINYGKANTAQAGPYQKCIIL